MIVNSAFFAIIIMEKPKMAPRSLYKKKKSTTSLSWAQKMRFQKLIIFFGGAMSYPMLQGILRENKKKVKKSELKIQESVPWSGPKLYYSGKKCLRLVKIFSYTNSVRVGTKKIKSFVPVSQIMQIISAWIDLCIFWDCYGHLSQLGMSHLDAF